MALYRIDYCDEAGGAIRPVKKDGRDFLCFHMTTARALAQETAAATGERLLISRIDSAGRIRAALIVTPTGASRPSGTRPMDARSDCKKDAGENVVCFCVRCRAERRGRG